MAAGLGENVATGVCLGGGGGFLVHFLLSLSPFSFSANIGGLSITSARSRKSEIERRLSIHDHGAGIKGLSGNLRPSGACRPRSIPFLSRALLGL